MAGVVPTNAHRDRYALATPFASGSQPVRRLVVTSRGTLASDHFMFADNPDNRRIEGLLGGRDIPNAARLTRQNT
jgi:hypothetical protein